MWDDALTDLLFVETNMWSSRDCRYSNISSLSLNLTPHQAIFSLPEPTSLVPPCQTWQTMSMPCASARHAIDEMTPVQTLKLGRFSAGQQKMIKQISKMRRPAAVVSKDQKNSETCWRG